ncbi:hypothetical protein DRO58_02510 [Candidatus Bathyarchaeota archaeon]|nr:MAG: hypothetical protein DRO58_02510 [Candidatus Bathyarchaeota archaeon]
MINMPPKGYRNLSIKEEVYKRLDDLSVKLNISMSELVARLLDEYIKIHEEDLHGQTDI